MQVKWGNSDIEVTLTLGAPTVGTAMIAGLTMDYLRRKVTTQGSLAIISMFVDMIRHTHKAEGLPFALLAWNSNADDIEACFTAWQAMPEELGDVWIDAITQVKGGANASGDAPPLATSTAKPNSTKSGKRGKRQPASPAALTG